MNRISKQKYTTGASFFLDELFSEHSSSACKEPSFPFSSTRKTKESPRVYKFNPQSVQRGRAPTAPECQPEIRGRSTTHF